MPIEHTTRNRLLMFRGWVNDNAAIVVLGAVVVLALALNRVSHYAAGRQPRSYSTHAWYYDTAAKQVVTRPVGLPPTVIENGRELWLVRVYACDDCSREPMEYYERCAPEHRERWQALYDRSLERALNENEHAEIYDLAMSAREYSRDGVTWLPLSPEVEMHLTDEFQARCGEGSMRACYPTAATAAQ